MKLTKKGALIALIISTGTAGQACAASPGNASNDGSVRVFRNHEGLNIVQDPPVYKAPQGLGQPLPTSPHAECVKVDVHEVGRDLHIVRCVFWRFGPSREQQQRFEATSRGLL